MKNGILYASEENIKKTFIEDSIGRNKDIFSFVELLNSIEDSCSIALDSYWGSGKTFFVKQVKLVLEQNNESIQVERDENVIQKWEKMYASKRFHMIPQMAVYFDAWNNDNDSDPLYSLLYQILSEYALLSETESEIGFNRISKAIVDILNLFDKTHVTTKVLSNLLSVKREDFLEDIKKEKKIECQIKEILSKIKEERADRIVVFIDELDRCRPDYAVKLLERVKHYFENDFITFVFSVNIAELQHTVKRFYGEGFNASRYLERFFDIRFGMPNLSKEKFYRYIDEGLYEGSSTYDCFMKEVIEEFGFEMREILRYVKLCRIARSKSNKVEVGFSDEKGKAIMIDLVAPFIIGLRLYDVCEYDEFINGKNATRFLALIERSHCRIKEYIFDINESQENTDITNRVEEIYNSLFARVKENSSLPIEVGRIKLDKQQIDLIKDVVNLTSRYRDLDVE